MQKPISLRITRLVAIVYLLSAILDFTAAAATANPPTTNSITYSQYRVASRGQNHITYERLGYQTNRLGHVVIHTNRYTELETGKHYWDTNQWRASSEEIQIVPSGAVARKGPHKAAFSSDIISGTEVLTPDNQRLKMRVLGMAYYDFKAGTHVLIAELTNSIGQLTATNIVLYTNAFTDFKADIRYTYTKSGVEQDVILRQRPPLPEAFGMNPISTRLLLLTEFIDPPTNVVTIQHLRRGWTNATVDKIIDFGLMQIGHGTAFGLGQEPDRRQGIPVQKHWSVLENRTFLIEEISFERLRPHLANLQAGLTRNPGTTSLLAQRPVTRSLSLPPIRLATLDPKFKVQNPMFDVQSPTFEVQGSKSEVQSSAALTSTLGPLFEVQASTFNVQSPPFPNSPQLAASAPQSLIQHPVTSIQQSINPSIHSSSAGAEPGLVLDFTLQNATSVTLQADETYLVTNHVTLSGTTTIEGGAVVKFAPGAQLTLGAVNMLTGPYRPATFTARDDNSLGTTVPSSTGLPTNTYADCALELTLGGDLKYVNIRYANEAIYCGNNDFSLSHSQIVQCNRGIHAETANFTNRNVLMYRVATNYYGSYFHGRIEHLTADQSDRLVQDWNFSYLESCDGAPSSALTLINSLTASITNSYGTYPLYNDHSREFLPATGIFQSVGAGAHYLVDSSTNRACGSTNLSAGLLAELKSRTTWPPLVFSNVLFSSNTNLGPRAIRDTNSFPDLGYHLDALDYAIKSVRLTNATMQILPGTSIGTFGQYGLGAISGSIIISQGAPTNLNRVVRFNLVQEHANTNWDGPGSSVVGNWQSGVPAQGSFKFTDFSMPAQDGPHFRTYFNSLNFAFTDCQFHGGQIQVWDPTVAATNCLFERVSITLDDSSMGNDVSPIIRNCTFYAGQFELNHWNSDTWLFRDNLFDHTAIIQDGDADNAYDAYTTGSTRLTPTNANDVVASLTFQTSWFGRFYQPTNSSFIDKGSVSDAGLVGLYHHAITTNQVAEQNTRVDLGFHYIATDASGNPRDTDSDGIPDYLENKDGSGVQAGGETSFLDPDTDHDGISDQWEKLYSLTDPLDPDTDYDGVVDGRELLEGTNPLNPHSFKPRRLGYWRFNNTTTWVGEQGQLPISPANGTPVTTWDGYGVRLTAANSSALAYRDYELDPAAANINLRHGTIRFWFKPDWGTVGVTNIHWNLAGSSLETGRGPGHTNILIEMGHATSDHSYGWWALCVNSDGNQIRLITEANGIQTIHFSTNIAFPKGKWQQIALTYTNDTGLSALYINGQLLTTGAAIANWPSRAARASGFRLGCGSVAGQQAEGVFEELETFNYPLPSQTVLGDYQSVMQIDTDHDGLPNVIEDEIGLTNPNNADSDGDGIPDGWEYAYLRLFTGSNGSTSLDPTHYDKSNNTYNDTDGDGKNNFDEWVAGTDPLVGEDRDDKLTFIQADQATDLVSIDFVPSATYVENSDAVKGPAAAGYTNTDSWNFFTECSDLFRGQALRDVAGNSVKMGLVALNGPYQLPSGTFNACCPYPTNGDNGSLESFTNHWRCLIANLDCLFPWTYACPWVPCGNNQNLVEVSCWTHLYADVPFWLNFARLGGTIPDLHSFPIWLPALDAPGDGGGVVPISREMGLDDLTSKIYGPNMPIGLDLQTYGTGPKGQSLHLYLTGLERGAYQVYVYSSPYHLLEPPRVNGRTNRVAKTWLAHPQNPSASIPYYRYSVQALTPQEIDAVSTSNLPPGGGGYYLGTNSPIWLDQGPRIEIAFPGGSQSFLPGIQILRLYPLPAPANVTARGGKRAVFLSWDRVATAESYQIYRSTNHDSGFKKVGSTSSRTYADAPLTPGITNYYYIIAENDIFQSPASAITNAIPFAGGGNSPPILDYVDPIQLSPEGDHFIVPFAKVLKASNARDMDGDVVSFKIQSVLNGTVTINNQPSPGVSNGYDTKATLVWTPASTVPSDGLEAFTVTAFDGLLRSSPAVPVKIVPVPKLYLMGWGNNEYGTLGNGENLTYQTTPTFSDRVKLSPIKVKNLDEVISVKHANDYAGSAVASDGSLWMWGRDAGAARFGEGKLTFLESGRDEGFPLPFRVQMFDGPSLKYFTNVMDVSMSQSQVMATRSDGTLWSWGESGWYALGYIPDPADIISGTAGWTKATKKARQVKGMTDASGKELVVIQTVADASAGLALCADGSVWFWGVLDLSSYDAEGVFSFERKYLLDRPTSDFRLPNRQRAFDVGSRVVEIAGGSSHYMARREDGTVWEFGYIPRLALTDPHPGCGAACYFSQEPLQTTGLPTTVKIKNIRADWNYALALLDDGTVYAWGNFGDKYEGAWQSDHPVPIPELKNIVKIDLSSEVAMALDSDGRVWAWGLNHSGQLGLPPGNPQVFISQPQPIFGLESASDIVAGGMSAFAIASLEENKPAALTAIPMDRKVRLDWRRFPGASEYVIYASTTHNGTFTEVGRTNSNSFTQGGLLNGTDYYFKVSAIVDSHETEKSQDAMATPLPPPVAPKWNGTPFGACRDIQLHWLATPTAAAYQIFRSESSTGPFTLLLRTTGLAFADASAALNQDYYYYIRAANAAGDSAASITNGPLHRDADSCPPAPATPTLAVAGQGRVVVTWPEVTINNTEHPQAYRLKWCYCRYAPTSSTTFVWREVAITDDHLSKNGNLYSYTIGDGGELPDDVVNWFKVSAIYNGVEGFDSPISAPIIPCQNCAPTAPPQPRAIPGYHQVYVDWQEDPKAYSYEVRYRIYVPNQDPEVNWTVADSIIDNRFWHYNTDVQHQYEYAVSSVNQVGQSAFSTPSTPVAPLSGPLPWNQVFTAQAVPFDGLVYIHWESLGNPPQFPTFVERKISGSNDSTYAVISGTGPGLAFIDEDVVNGVSYVYRVTALHPTYLRSFAVTDPVTPVANGALPLWARSGNSHVRLTWASLGADRYQLKHSLQRGGPYDIIATITSSTDFTHQNIQNGVDHYYVLTAILPSNVAVESLEVKARPLATLQPLPPVHLHAELGSSEEAYKIKVLLSWPPSPGAINYVLYHYFNTGFTNIYFGDATSFSFLIDTQALSDGDLMQFQVAAVNSQNVTSDFTHAKIRYTPQSVGDTGKVLLSIASHDVVAGDPGLTVTGPTNLVLRASITDDAAVDAQVYFYDLFNGSQTVIGTAQAPDAQITWFNVPQGLHTISAQVVVAGHYPLTTSKTWNSRTCDVKVRMLPDLATYQTAVADLQLPAPGLPIVLSRSYDSRGTNITGVLAKGWHASWDESAIKIASPLSQGWKGGGIGGIDHNHWYVAEVSSHLITITLPGGATTYFAAQPNVREGYDPLLDAELGFHSIALDFVSFSPGQGTLTCTGNANPSQLTTLGDLNDVWRDHAVPINIDSDTPDTDFVPANFVYTTPDGTQYLFRFDNATLSGRLSSITDRNGNCLTNIYDANSRLTSIQHSNGRKVQFTYSTVTGGTNISVFDTIGDTNTIPVLKYQIRNGFLTEIDRLVNRAGSGSYQPTKYTYGDSGNAIDRLTTIYDARGIRVLYNEYGNTGGGTNVPDGRLIRQTDAAYRTTTYTLDPVDYTIKSVRQVNGASETNRVDHDTSGAIAQVTDAAGNTNGFTYDSRGRLTAKTDSAGKTSTISYDYNDRPVSQSDPAGHTTSTQLNSRGQPVTTTDANGNTNYFEYDDSGNPATAYDSAGVETITTYTWISNIVSGVTNVIAAGLVESETRQAPDVPHPVVTAYTYYTASSTSGNFPGEIKTVTEKWLDGGTAPPPTTYEYDANGNRTNETRKATVNGAANTDVITRFQYDGQNRLIHTIDPLGRTSTVVYNTLGKQAATIDALGRTTSYLYDVLGNLIETTYPDSTVTRTVFDEKNRATVTQERAVPDANGLTTAPATVNTYDKAGRIIRVDRRSGVILNRRVANPGEDYEDADATNAVFTTYQAQVFAETQYTVIVNDLGTLESLTRTSYDLVGRVEYSMDARGTVTRSLYDDAGQRTNSLVYTSYTVNPLATGSLVPSNTNAMITTYGYDPNGNQVWILDAAGHQTDFEFDADNRLVRTTFPLVAGDTGRKSRSTTYDGLGRRLRETDEAGVINEFAYDFRGLLTSVTLDIGTNALTTSYKYDEAGNQIEQTDALNRTTKFQYDKLGRRTKRTLPDNTSTETTGYEDIPETTGSAIKVSRTTIQDFGGHTITNTQDRLDRPKTRTLPAINSGESGTLVTYEYELFGQPARVTQSGDVSRTVRYAYDSLRRLRVQETPEGTLSYVYGSAGAVNTISARTNFTGWASSPPYQFSSLSGALNNANSAQWNYRYDNFGRLIKVNPDSSAENATADATYTYYDVGSVQTMTYRNGLATTYTYNERNWLRMLETKLSTTTVARFDYDSAASGANWSAERRLSPTGQRRRMAELIGSNSRTVDHDYDRIHRLVKEDIDPSSAGPTGNIRYDVVNTGATTEGYDKVGNRLSRQVSSSALESAGVTGYSGHTFNSRDLLDTGTTPNASYDDNGNTSAYGGDSYKYDAENRIVRRIRSGSSDALFTYDATGNRVKKVVGSTTTLYLVDSLNPSGYAQVMEERDATGTPTVAYVYGLALISQTRSGTASYYGQDGLGSIRYLSSPSGSITDTYTFDAFGIQIASSGTTLNSHGYTGQYLDTDLGMYYLRARYYRSELGRFWTMDKYEGNQEDPLSLNKYLYCRGDPANRIDPSGCSDLISFNFSMAIRTGIAGAALGAYSAGRMGGNVFGGAAYGFLSGFVGGGAFGALPGAVWGTKAGVATLAALSAYAVNSAVGYARAGYYDLAAISLGLALSPVAEANLNPGQTRSGNVRVYRVQGGGSQDLITLEPGGVVSIKNKMLNVSFGDESHALYFKQNNRPNGYIISFEIPRWLMDFIESTAIQEAGASSNPANHGGLAPKLMDPTKEGVKYELPPPWTKWLEENQVRGSAKLDH